MSRKHRQFAGEAAERASEAARVLQQRSQEVKSETQQTEQPQQTQDKPQEKVQEGRRPELRNEERDAAMDEVYQRHDKAAFGETPEAPETTEQATEETLAETTAETHTEAAPEPKTVKVKVDGEEFEVPEAEVEAAGGVTAYQKDKAAENRLKKANEALSQVRQTQAQLAQWAQAQAPKPQNVPPTVNQLLQESIDTIRWGTPEESAAALQKVIELSNPKTDPMAITNYAIAKMQQTTALESFKSEFADVIANPLVLKLATTLENEWLSELSKKGQVPADWGHLYRSVGNQARSVMGRPNQPSTAKPNDSPSQADKEARKASIVNLPTASARAALPEAPKPQTREEILAEMKQNRMS